MSILANVRKWIDWEAVEKDDFAKRRADRAECDRLKAEELAALQQPAKDVQAIMAADADADDQAAHADYLAAIEYVAAKKSDSDKPTVIRKGSAWMRKVKISPTAFAFDVRAWINKQIYDRTLANYESDLKTLVKDRDAAKAKLTKAENDLKIAKDKFSAADLAATQLEQTNTAYEIFKRRHIRLFGSTAENLDINARNYAYSLNGWAV